MKLIFYDVDIFIENYLLIEITILNIKYKLNSIMIN